MTTTPDMQLKAGEQPRLAAGTWRVSPPQSHASFAARMAGRTVRGHLPLTGEVQITEPIEGSTARLAARTSAVRTGSAVLDRLLAGPAFLDATAYPEISFRSELLVWVPTGWRAVGRLRVRNAETNWPASSTCTLATPGRAARRVSSSPPAGSSTRPGLPASESRPSATASR